jgi:hypothetical protein|tara:strand:- start:244 stop:348 length:105 start_codon:yes stop_codon:yes gene_type:complete
MIGKKTTKPSAKDQKKAPAVKAAPKAKVVKGSKR